MPGAYKWKPLCECNINDDFFNSLKNDYPSFEDWFSRKSAEGKHAFTYNDEQGLGAFVMLKYDEEEEITLQNKTLPSLKRLKISTLKLADRIQGNRLGEGAIGIALWRWLESNDEEIYVTIFDKHDKLIDMVLKFGFNLAGYNLNGEGVYLKSKSNIDFSTPYTSFPFINKDENSFALLPIEADWHDKLFPYSQLCNTKQKTEEFSAANGITKTYICFPYQIPKYKINQPILIYRKCDKKSIPKYKSVITSYGTIVKIKQIKYNGKNICSKEEYIKLVGNKSVFTKKQIEDFYNYKYNLYVLELVYNHAFGAGNNVNYDTLKRNNIWSDLYPYQAEYTMNDFKSILKFAHQNEDKLIK